MGSKGEGSLKLDVKIIGGGIGGLACALALARNGHEVSVYESNMELSEFGAGIQIAPNATRIIYQWGLQNEFLKVVNQPEVMNVRRYSDDRVLGELPHNPISDWEYGFPHWQIYRPDFQELLYQAAVKAGVKVHFGKRISEVDVEKGQFKLQDGTVETADLIIGADGISSRTRSCLSPAEPRPFKEFCFRAVVPKEKMLQDEATAKLMAGHMSMIWCGQNIAVLGYPVAAGQLYNVVLAVPRPSDAPVGKWNEPGDINEGAGLLKDFCPSVRLVWSKVEECAKWTLADLPPIESYVSENGKLVLVGDAAHAIIPHLGQGGGQALEDSAALAEFTSSMNSLDELPGRMQAYQAFRQMRMECIRGMASGNQRLLTMEDGPDQEKRDAGWAAVTKKWKKEFEEMGEEGIRNIKRPVPNPNAVSMMSPEGREYLYAFDVAAEARKVVESL
jgi:salicylate hydroxylase